jgi:hypothetical protein
MQLSRISGSARQDARVKVTLTLVIVIVTAVGSHGEHPLVHGRVTANRLASRARPRVAMTDRYGIARFHLANGSWLLRAYRSGKVCGAKPIGVGFFDEAHPRARRPRLRSQMTIASHVGSEVFSNRPTLRASCQESHSGGGEAARRDGRPREGRRPREAGAPQEVSDVDAQLAH